VDRVIGLIRILTGSSANGLKASVILPSRKDIAEITALRLETVSRIIKGLERAGTLLPAKAQGVHAARSFTLNFAPRAA
jgi:DNA-binding transcriptional regulator YhcF (GntR family)